MAYTTYSKLLARWVMYSQQHLYEVPGGEGLVCYGQADHGHWGVQTQQKAFAAFAVAALAFLLMRIHRFVAEFH